MKPPRFDYAAPTTIDDALQLLFEHPEKAQILAGGQSLIPKLNARRVRPKLLVDVNLISELASVQVEPGLLSIGAMVRQVELERDPQVAAFCSLLGEAVSWVGTPQTRNRGTLGGSLAEASFGAELPAVCIATGALLRLRSKGRERVIPADTFFLSTGETARQPNELLTHILFPAPSNRHGWAFLEARLRQPGVCIVGVAVELALDEHERCVAVTVVITGLSRAPWRARSIEEKLLEERWSESLLRRITREGLGEPVPFESPYLPMAYRTHIALGLTEKALEVAFQRARSLS